VEEREEWLEDTESECADNVSEKQLPPLDLRNTVEVMI
jgi:hypothetical protein